MTYATVSPASRRKCSRKKWSFQETATSTPAPATPPAHGRWRTAGAPLQPARPAQASPLSRRRRAQEPHEGLPVVDLRAERVVFVFVFVSFRFRFRFRFFQRGSVGKIAQPLPDGRGVFSGFRVGDARARLRFDRERRVQRRGGIHIEVFVREPRDDRRVRAQAPPLARGARDDQVKRETKRRRRRSDVPSTFRLDAVPPVAFRIRRRSRRQYRPRLLRGKKPRVRREPLDERDAEQSARSLAARAALIQRRENARARIFLSSSPLVSGPDAWLCAYE